jgi:autoinducer 2 (AI-2) kinase
VEGIGFYHGFTLRWFRDGFCHREMEKASRDKKDPYDLMEELARTVPPGSNGVHAVFSNIMNVRAWKHAASSFLGFDVMNAGGTGKAACIRALEEHAAYTSRAHLQILQEISGHSPDSIVFSGGSAKGKLWPQILSDVLQVRVRIPRIKETTALGAFICASAALGWFESFQEAAERVITCEREVEPNPENAAPYTEYYDQWCALYPYVQEIADAGILPSMWRAPGA